MQIINNPFEYSNEGDVLIIPIFSNDYDIKPIIDLVALYVYNFQSEEDYLFPFNHNDTENLSYDVLDKLKFHPMIWVYDKKKFVKLGLDWQVYDIDLLVYMKTNSRMTDKVITNAHSHFDKFKSLASKNSIIPITKHIEFCTNIKNNFLKYYELPKVPVPAGFLDYNNKVFETLEFIEQSGIQVVEAMINKRFPLIPVIDNKVYTNYNIYTLTGRPSNSQYNMNFAALKKSDNTRDALISRYRDVSGKLIQYDYDSYHLRLIAKLINYTFPEKTNIHDYLGKYYFNKEELNEEEYNESKIISFRQLYGGVQPEYKNIPFFEKTTRLINKIWKHWEENGYIVTPVFGRKFTKDMFEDMNPTKLFNYILQAFETERNMDVINKLIPIYETAKSKIVLYTYDAILIDYNPEDGHEICIRTEDILQDGGFPVSIKSGQNYGKLESGY